MSKQLMARFMTFVLNYLIIALSNWMIPCAASNSYRRDWSSIGSGVHLRLAASVETSGNAGFEAFQIDGRQFLAAANFWDGNSEDMSAESKVYIVSASNEHHKSSVANSSTYNPLVLTEAQSFKTKGAHGWDYFEVLMDERASVRRFLVVPNYYACGNSAADAKRNCKSTVIYEWHPEEATFVKFQKLSTNGPGQTDHFSLSDGRAFIVVSENFGNEVCVYQFIPSKRHNASEITESRSKFKKVQCLACQGAGAIAIANSVDDLLLVATSYHDPKTSWKTRSLVFRLADQAFKDGASQTNLRHGFEGFEFFQQFDTHGAHDAEFRSFEGQHFLFISEDRSDSSSKVDSQLFVFNGSSGKQRFKLLQKIPTDGAHAAEFFEFGDTLWLAVANFGDRLGGRYAALSSLWRYDRLEGAFEKITEIETHGATDWEHFILDGMHYLAVSNEGNLPLKQFQTSHIYQLLAEEQTASGPSTNQDANSQRDDL